MMMIFYRQFKRIGNVELAKCERAHVIIEREVNDDYSVSDLVDI